jgi:hypothetical protein
MLTELKMHDVVRLRKTHPCGSTDWEVIRLGADIRLKCQGCGRLIMFTRRELKNKIKGWVLREDEEA